MRNNGAKVKQNIGQRNYLCGSIFYKRSFIGLAIFFSICGPAQNYLNKARWHINNGDFLEAKNLLESGLKKNFKDQEFYFWYLAELSIALEKNKDASNFFLKLLNEKPDFLPHKNTAPKILQHFLAVKKNYLKSDGYQKKLSPKLILLEDKNYLNIRTILKEIPKTKISGVKIFIKDYQQSNYISFYLAKHEYYFEKSIEKNFFDFPLLNYFIEFYGENGQKFFLIGSEKNPKTFLLDKSLELNLEENIPKSKAWYSFENYWPHYLAISLFLSGATIFLATHWAHD